MPEWGSFSAAILAAAFSARCKRVAADLDPALTLNAIAAWGTFFAALIAAISVVVSWRLVRRQIAAQIAFERRRLEADYLRAALDVIRECHDGADVYVISMANWRHHLTGRSAKPEELRDMGHLREALLSRWILFDRAIRNAAAMLRATEGQSSLVKELEAVYALSATLFDELMKAGLTEAGAPERPEQLASYRKLSEAIETATNTLTARLAATFAIDV